MSTPLTMLFSRAPPPLLTLSRFLSCPPDSAASYAPAQLIGHLTKRLVVVVFGESQDGGAEGFGIISRSKRAIVDENELIKDQVRHSLELSHEAWVHVDLESGFGVLAVRHRVGELAFEQRGGVENDFARITGRGAILQNPPQFLPADARAKLFPNLFAPGGDMRVERLLEILNCELLRHAIGSWLCPATPLALRVRNREGHRCFWKCGPEGWEWPCAGRRCRPANRRPKFPDKPASRSRWAYIRPSRPTGWE